MLSVMTKLIIQIPCLNEAGTLDIALKALPREVPGFDTVEWLIIDDGSTDDTVKVARENGIDHVVQHTQNKGLAYAFMSGLDAALKLGADVIVNTDADNQYNAGDIPALVLPIIEKRADIVIGARPISEIDHFSPVKKSLQKLGSWVVRVTSGTDVQDAPSGFRAISRDAAKQMMVFNEFTYTLETIIQAGRRNLKIESVPVAVNEDLRPSRLFKSIPSYIQRSILVICRIFVIYKPMKFLSAIALMLLILGLIPGLRFVYFYMTGNGDGHVQSVILAGLLLNMSFFTFLIAVVADLISANRRLLEDIRVSTRDFS